MHIEGGKKIVGLYIETCGLTVWFFWLLLIVKIWRLIIFIRGIVLVRVFMASNELKQKFLVVPPALLRKLKKL